MISNEDVLEKMQEKIAVLWTFIENSQRNIEEKNLPVLQTKKNKAKMVSKVRIDLGKMELKEDTLLESKRL